MPVKKPWFSKTVWMSLIVAVAAFIPGVGEYVAANVETVGIVLGVVFSALRLISNGKISID